MHQYYEIMLDESKTQRFWVYLFPTIAYGLFSNCSMAAENHATLIADPVGKLRKLEASQLYPTNT